MAVVTGQLVAQNLFFIENEGKMAHVKAADGDTCVIVDGGKRVSFNESAHFALHPLFVSEAVYPNTLKNRVKGQAEIAFHVDARGVVVNPVVSSATDPAFGAAAVEALRQWRFVPRVRNGVAVDAAAELPFVFDPRS